MGSYFSKLSCCSSTTIVPINSTNKSENANQSNVPNNDTYVFKQGIDIAYDGSAVVRVSDQSEEDGIIRQLRCTGSPTCTSSPQQPIIYRDETSEFSKTLLDLPEEILSNILLQVAVSSALSPQFSNRDLTDVYWSLAPVCHMIRQIIATHKFKKLYGARVLAEDPTRCYTTSPNLEMAILSGDEHGLYVPPLGSAGNDFQLDGLASAMTILQDQLFVAFEWTETKIHVYPFEYRNIKHISKKKIVQTRGVVFHSCYAMNVRGLLHIVSLAACLDNFSLYGLERKGDFDTELFKVCAKQGTVQKMCKVGSSAIKVHTKPGSTNIFVQKYSPSEMSVYEYTEDSTPIRICNSALDPGHLENLMLHTDCFMGNLSMIHLYRTSKDMLLCIRPVLLNADEKGNIYSKNFQAWVIPHEIRSDGKAVFGKKKMLGWPSWRWPYTRDINAAMAFDPSRGLLFRVSSPSEIHILSVFCAGSIWVPESRASYPT